MKAVFLTAGAAGMYCGSCMHDNALARALRDRGVDCMLQPVYTPIRTDSQSVANDQVFFGGIQIYLLQQMPWLRFAPRPLRRTLDWPPFIRWATKRASATDAAKLGALSISMLKGTHGRQATEMRRLIDWFDSLKPDAIVLSNLLIGGALPEIRECLPDARIAVLLQGDDIFLDYLPEAMRAEATTLCSELVNHVDHVIVHSHFYGNKMAALLAIPDEKIVITPLSIDLAPFAVPRQVADPDRTEFRLGYLARVAPEKGLHRLVDAFISLAQQPSNHDLTLHVAGWLGAANESYLEGLKTRIADAGLQNRFRYHGSPDLAGKVKLLQSLDLLSVPTDYEDPKGLFVLEALAAGVAVVQPHHGAFAELIESTGGGITVTPNSVEALSEAIQKLKDDPQLRRQLATFGLTSVHEKHSIETAAAQLHDLLGDPSQQRSSKPSPKSPAP